MSYILTALKQAEQARGAGRNSAASTQPVGSASGGAPSAPAAGNARLPWLGLLAVMAVMIAVLLFAIVRGDGLESLPESPAPHTPDSADPVVNQAEASIVQLSASEQADKGGNSRAAAQVNTYSGAAGIASERPRTQTQVAPREAPAFVPPIAAAKAADEAAAPLPALNITGYIFFENKPAASKLFVDGIVYRLGSSLGDSTTIREFKSDRVIVSRRGTDHEIIIP